MMKEFDTQKAIYLQIYEWICKQMIQGTYRHGEKLPSVREMALTCGVNPNTIQRAYRELEEHHLAFTKRGQGTFVTEEESEIIKMKNEMITTELNLFIAQMNELGVTGEELIERVKQAMKEGGK